MSLLTTSYTVIVVSASEEQWNYLAQQIHPEKELSDRIRYSREDSVEQRINDVYSVHSLRTALDDQGAKILEGMFLLLRTSEQRVVGKEEQKIHQVKNYLGRVASKI